MSMVRSTHLSLLTFALATGLAACGVDGSSQVQGADRLGVGSVAPKLNVEHWLQNGDGRFKKVTSFEPGKVYVVEFWATYCGPCIESMPHLASLQTQYADKGLQIISISTEDLETVTKFMKREIPDEDGNKRSVSEITKAYCLTTDPDGSSDNDYMNAARQDGIPCAFIVGKDSKIDWIGHPGEMDDVLAAVLEDKWDRAQYIAEQKLIEDIQSKIGGLVQKKKFAEAAKAIEGFLEKITDKRIQFTLLKSKLDLLVRANAEAGQIKQTYIDLFANCETDPMFVQDVAWTAYESYTDNKIDSKEIIRMSIAAVEKVLDKVSGPDKANLLDTIAHLNFSIGKFEPAIQAQTQAVKLSDGSDGGSFKEFLDELQTEAKKLKK